MIRRILTITLTLLALTSSMMGQSKVSPFTTNYMRGQQTLTRSTVADEVVSCYIHTVGATDVSAIEALGAKVTVQLDGILIARVPLSAIGQLATLEFIKYIQMGTPVREMMDKARAVSGVDKVLGAEALDMPYTGKGVVVGIIDGGFDYTHPAFFDDATGALRIKRVWEQGTTEGNVPEGFGYGIELTTEEAILAAAADNTIQSHGSHVAAIAAGANRVEGNPYYGIAPDADIVLVSKGVTTANCANISDAIAYIYNYADEVGKPCVVNMSLGWNQGPHDGTSAFDNVADQLQGPGRVLVGSMGNYGSDAVHVSKTFTGAEDSPLKAMVYYKVSPTASNVGGEIDIWGEKGMEFDLKVIVTRTSDGEEVLASEVMNVSAAEGSTQEFTLSNRMKGNVIITTEVNPLNGKPHAFLTLGVTSRGMGMTIGVVVTPRSAGTVHAWADAGYTTFETEVPEGWTAGEKNYTLCEIGGTGKEIISVGAYVSSDTYVEYGSTQTKRTDEKLGTVASFSSVGPTIDGRIKPDILAPGSFIASAVNSYDAYRSSYPSALVVAKDDRAYYYSYMQGTSMAAPFVSGVIATWLQAHPTLDSEAIRSVLSKTAVNDDYTTTATSGYGKIDAYNGLREVLALAAAGIDPVMNAQYSCLLTRTNASDWTLHYLEAVEAHTVTVFDVAGHQVSSFALPAMQQGSSYTLPLGQLASGIYLVKAGGKTFRIVL